MATNKKNTDDSGTKPEEQAAKKRPVKVIPVEDISVSIFAHEREVNGTMRVNYSWAPQRNWKDSAGQWKHSPWFGQDDFGKVVAAIQQASEWVHEQQNAEQEA